MFKRILVLLLLFGSTVFFYHLSRWISWRLAPSVDGVVERVEIAKTLLSPDPRNPVDGWEPRVTSRYTVAGHLYRSNRVNYVSLNVQERGVGTVPYAQASIRGYRPGGKVRVFYRRERPDQSALKTPFPELLAFFSLFPLALLVMGGVSLFKGKR